MMRDTSSERVRWSYKRDLHSESVSRERLWKPVVELEQTICFQDRSRGLDAHNNLRPCNYNLLRRADVRENSRR